MITGAALLLDLLFHGIVAGRKAIWVSAVVAMVVQLLTFAILIPAMEVPDEPGGMLMRWGIGAVIRMLALMFYALLVQVATNLPPAPALISLFVFFFTTMLLEPLLLRETRTKSNAS